MSYWGHLSPAKQGNLFENERQLNYVSFTPNYIGPKRDLP